MANSHALAIVQVLLAGIYLPQIPSSSVVSYTGLWRQRDSCPSREGRAELLIASFRE